MGKMTVKELRNQRRQFLDLYYPYKLSYYKNFYYPVLKNIMTQRRRGRGDNDSYNDCIIMADTETSKCRGNAVSVLKGMKNYAPVDNYVVAWTISIRAFDRNLVTLWGHKPSEFIECVNMITEELPGERTIIYFHNLSYDWVFLRRFMIKEWGIPDRQLNTKSHYPILIQFHDGLVFRDSLILAQRSLEKWANDLDVEHKKSVGKWDYDKIRTQKEILTSDELEYIEHDTLAGVECLQKTMDMLNKRIYSMPYTATGIPREEVRKLAQKNRGHDRFLRQALSYEQYGTVNTWVYHGGYTHGNRYYIEETVRGWIEAYDFASSYPFVMLSEKYPCESFTPLPNCSCDKILSKAENNAFYFKFIATNIQLSDYYFEMPALQVSKCVQLLNPVVDNGRVLQADYVEIWLTELDLEVIEATYEWQKHLCTHIYFARKDYLPRWFTDYIYELFKAKTKLKGGDPVAYAIAKAKLNSLYGMCVQRLIRENIVENYETGEYSVAESDPEEEYQKVLKRRSSVLPYQWGTWVTAYAFRNLFQLGSCAGEWYYSDTDSCYGSAWNKAEICRYNRRCKEKLLERGYGPVKHKGRDYWLGVAEPDGQYTEFRVLGAKRYCVRNGDELKITVAGVPKKGAACLNDDIENFTAGMIFPGEVTGKKAHHYIYKEIWTDEKGNECADSVDLTPADYTMDSVYVPDWDLFDYEITTIHVYEEV